MDKSLLLRTEKQIYIFVTTQKNLLALAKQAVIKEKNASIRARGRSPLLYFTTLAYLVMVAIKQLSRDGYYSINFILNHHEINPKDSHRICYETLKQIGQLPSTTQTQEYDYPKDILFPRYINPNSWVNFFHERDPVPEKSYSAFCTLAEEFDPDAEFCRKKAATFDLSRPSDAERIFKDCRKQVECLLEAASKRLLIPEDDIDTQLKLYKTMLGIKNREFLIDKEHVHKLAESDIYYDSIGYVNNTPVLKIRLRARILLPNCEAQHVTWGFAMVNTESGCSELLLDNRPFVWTGNEVKVGEQSLRKVRLPDGVRLTEKAIQLLREACKRYAGQQRISNFGGWLKDTNLTIFRNSYLTLRRSGITDENELNYRALMDTPFGKARCRLGITSFKIHSGDWDSKGIPKYVFIKSACEPGRENFSL
ncbi:MAG: hypothetical protein AAGD09_22575 [Cyanobacteria bacterium P01_F01_bin.56]